MENNELIIRKIPLKALMEILRDAWDRGADYIDIIGSTADVQDNVAVAIRPEYMNVNPDDEFEIEVEESDVEDGDGDENLTDDELNQLL